MRVYKIKKTGFYKSLKFARKTSFVKQSPIARITEFAKCTTKSIYKMFLFKKTTIAFLLFTSMQAFSLQSSAIPLPLGQVYVGAGISSYYDGNSQSSTSNKLSNYKGVAGIRFAGLLSVEAEYANYNVTKNNTSSGQRNFDVENYGLNVYLNPPIVRLFGNGLEAILGAGVVQNTYKDKATGSKYRKEIPKAILGARFIVLNKFAVFATSEFMLSKPQMATSPYSPIILTTGVNYLFW